VSDDTLELARRLARFKPSVRRSLGRSVNLDARIAGAEYRHRTLTELEELADDEDEELLVHLLRVRDALARQPDLDTSAGETGTTAVRDYRFGARSG
jgi:hypothetical protein